MIITFKLEPYCIFLFESEEHAKIHPCLAWTHSNKHDNFIIFRLQNPQRPPCTTTTPQSMNHPISNILQSYIHFVLIPFPP